MIVEITLLGVLKVFHVVVPLSLEQTIEIRFFIEGNDFWVSVFELSRASEAFHDVLGVDSGYSYLEF